MSHDIAEKPSAYYVWQLVQQYSLTVLRDYLDHARRESWASEALGEDEAFWDSMVELYEAAIAQKLKVLPRYQPPVSKGNVSFIDPVEIKERVDIVDLIGQTVILKKRGSTFWGLCPFHDEKTPSFHVFPFGTRSDGFPHAYCFGCGWHGTVIDFVMRERNLLYTEALVELARVAGLPVIERSAADKGLWAGAL